MLKINAYNFKSRYLAYTLKFTIKSLIADSKVNYLFNFNFLNFLIFGKASKYLHVFPWIPHLTLCPYPLSSSNTAFS